MFATMTTAERVATLAECVGMLPEMDVVFVHGGLPDLGFCPNTSSRRAPTHYR